MVKGRDYMSQAAWLLRVNASSADARVLLWLDQAAAPKADIIAQVCLSWYVSRALVSCPIAFEH